MRLKQIALLLVCVMKLSNYCPFCSFEFAMSQFDYTRSCTMLCFCKYQTMIRYLQFKNGYRKIVSYKVVIKDNEIISNLIEKTTMLITKDRKMFSFDFLTKLPLSIVELNEIHLKLEKLSMYAD